MWHEIVDWLINIVKIQFLQYHKFDEKYVESNEFWENVGAFADMATRRNTKRCVEFKKLLAKCRVGKVDLILTKSISRFGRNSLEAIQVLHRLYGLNVDVYFEKEDMRTGL